MHEGLRLQHLQQGLGGAKDVKLLGRETELPRAVPAAQRRRARASASCRPRCSMLPRLWLELLAVTGLATLVITMLAQGRDVEHHHAHARPVRRGRVPADAVGESRARAPRRSLRYYMPVVNTLHEELKLAVAERLPQRRASAAVPAATLQLASVDATATRPLPRAAARPTSASPSARASPSASSVRAARARARWSTSCSACSPRTAGGCWSTARTSSATCAAGRTRSATCRSRST